MEYGLGKEGLAVSLQELLAQNEVNQRASLGVLQQMDGIGSSYPMRANASLQQTFPAALNHPVSHRAGEHQKLEDARRALRAALVNWHACYQEVRLCQPMVAGAAPVNSQVVHQLSTLSQNNSPISLPPGLDLPEANTPSAVSPSSGLGSPYVKEVAHPWYVPVAGQFFSNAHTAQHEPHKMSPTKFAETNTKAPEEVCAAAGADTETLRTHLQALLKFEASCIIIVRKINRLGFESAHVLKDHFSLRGTVVEVYVAHSRVKPPNSNCRQSHGSRWRPSGLGFVVMSCAEEAAAILKQGGEQDICGCTIRVQKFERRAAMDSLDKAEEKQQNVHGLCEGDEGPESRLVGA
eukprot:TRINITY_DN92294_c0_g1_i1.p1 TRINITY_DN92294_c0_g1~~TRINITY_DN92294_c0_g1_i1.p1  ORF type:complete len:370 (-),score=62.50 TRINITY_DN92294_c0_g1_i1:123-1172(-)